MVSLDISLLVQLFIIIVIFTTSTYFATFIVDFPFPYWWFGRTTIAPWISVASMQSSEENLGSFKVVPWSYEVVSRRSKVFQRSSEFAQRCFEFHPRKSRIIQQRSVECQWSSQISQLTFRVFLRSSEISLWSLDAFPDRCAFSQQSSVVFSKALMCPF